MPKAVWNDMIVADSDDTVILEGNYYFPRSALREDVLRESETHTVCLWKGRASYYTLESDGDTASDAVCYYPDPKPDAAMIRGRVAFRKGVRVVVD
jgi:uncharacterized protein (DUF427 family)